MNTPTTTDVSQSVQGKQQVLKENAHPLASAFATTASVSSQQHQPSPTPPPPIPPRRGANSPQPPPQLPSPQEQRYCSSPVTEAPQQQQVKQAQRSQQAAPSAVNTDPLGALKLEQLNITPRVLIYTYNSLVQNFKFLFVKILSQSSNMKFPLPFCLKSAQGEGGGRANLDHVYLISIFIYVYIDNTPPTPTEEARGRSWERLGRWRWLSI